MERTRILFAQIASGNDTMLIAAFNGLIIQNGGATGHAQSQVDAVVDVDVGSSRELVKDKGTKGLLVPMQFKRQELVVGKMS